MHLYRKYTTKTSAQPKHAHIDGDLIYISCMKGKSVNVFLNERYSVRQINNIKYDNECIETKKIGNFLYTTLVDFNYDKSKLDHIGISNPKDFSILSEMCTGGKWSKVIHDFSEECILVSNWFSNDISVLNIENPSKPILLQTVDCGTSPKGIASTKDKKTILVACYYSRNIIEMGFDNGLLYVKKIGKPYDYPNYSGNMRDIIIDENRNVAYVSNMGRGLVHIYSLKEKEIISSVIVGEFPNSISFYLENFIVVSCKNSNKLFILSRDTLEIVGYSDKIDSPMGLCSAGSVIFSTSFRKDELVLFDLTQ